MKSTYKVLFLLAFGVSVLALPSDAYACSCMNITEEQALEFSTASFIGVPIEIRSPSEFNLVTFEIEEPIKNISIDTKQIVLMTHTQSAACGYNFDIDTRYLVHTYGESGQKTLETGLCSGNQNLGLSVLPFLTSPEIPEDSPETPEESSDWMIDFLLLLGIVSAGAGIAIAVYGYNKRKSMMS